MKPDFGMRDEHIYMDNAATTRLAEEVVEAMQPYLEERYGNPATAYGLGLEANDAVEAAREHVAIPIDAKPDEIFFTSGGTEANNWAIKGVGITEKQGAIVSSKVEHPSIVESVKSRAREEFPWCWCLVDVDEQGRVLVDEIRNEIEGNDVRLVSIQLANNETGTLQPVKEIGALCREKGVIFHCDACQAYTKIPIDVDDLNVDLMTLSAHKIHGPMGVGALYIRKGTKIEPLLHGGGHEGGMRSGTLPVQQIVGFGKAAEIGWTTMKKVMPKLRLAVEEMGSDLTARCGAKVNGSQTDRLPNILNVTIPGVDASALCGILDVEHGIAISTGSACQKKATKKHVLRAMGRTDEEVCSSVRISLSRYNKWEQAKLVVARIQEAIRIGNERDL